VRGGKELHIKKSLTRFAGGLVISASLLAGARAETLKIGVVASLTGGGAAWGMAVAEATRIVASEVNAKGGLDVGGKKYQIAVVAYDDQFKTADAVAAYNRLLNQDGVRYMVIQTSNGAMALKQNVEDDKVVVLTAGYGGKVVDSSNRYMFRYYSGPRDYMPAFIAWMKDNMKAGRIALINPNIEGGYEGAELANRLYKQNGFDVVDAQVYEMSQKDFQPQITKIISLNPNIIDIGSSAPATAGLIVRQARELGFKGQFVKTAGPGENEIVAAAGKEASEGLIGLLFADPANKGYQHIAAEYRKSVGQEPNEMLLPCYDGVNVLLRAIQKAGDVNDTAKVRNAFAQVLPTISVQGEELKLGGKDVYGADQEIVTVNYIGVIRNGEPVVIGKAR
jgi:branched-chain amino acid transport system substrate-binding protein